jgi:hypothetical protein
MNLTPVYLVKNKALSADSGTIYVDLPLNEQISALVFEFNCNKTSTADHTNPVFDQLGKIEVLLDGSKTAFSAEVEVGSILAWLTSGQIPPHEPRERGTAEVCLPIYFGRWPRDEQYGLDTSGYKSAQLQVSYNMDTTDWATGTCTYTVYYLRPVERVSWQGFVRSRTIHLLTSSGSASTEYIELPHGLPWLRVGIRNFDIDQYIYNDITAVKFTVDDGRVDLMTADTDDLININRERYGGVLKSYAVDSMLVDGDYPQTYLALMRDLEICSFAASVRILGFDSWLGHRFHAKMISDAGAAIATAETVNYRAGGYCFHGGLILFDNAINPFPAPGHANGKIELTLGAYTSVTETFLQELVAGTL